MENSLKGLMLAAGIIITCIIISLGLLDHLPEKNEIIITDDDVLLRVEQMDKNRIEKIYIKKPEPKEEA